MPALDLMAYPSESFMKYILIAGGTICVAFGVMGIFIPILPTTPFLLLAAALYFRSSETLYNKLLGHRILGKYIRNYLENKSIPVRAKIMGVSLVWLTNLFCIFWIVSAIEIKILLFAVAIGVTIFLLSLKTS